MRLAFAMAREAIATGAVDPVRMRELCTGPDGAERGLAAMTAAAGVLLNAAALERAARRGAVGDDLGAAKTDAVDEIVAELIEFVEVGELDHLERLFDAE